MFRKTFPVLLALVTALGSSAAVIAASPLYVSSALEDRVEERRLERLGQSSSSFSSSRTLRYIRTSSSSSSRRSATLESRVEQRLQERLGDIRQEDPDQYELIIDIMRRREKRRADRLESTEEPLKIQVANAVNMERARLGIPPLRYHPDLETAAQAHAQDMKNRDYFAHENPEGERSGERIKRTGYGVINAQECRCSYKVALGENIAKGQTSVEQVVREWMNSESHREAMLSRDYKEIGVGIIDDIWVLNFGSVETYPAGTRF